MKASELNGTPLIAAMRCVVATAVGDDTELEIPEN